MRFNSLSKPLKCLQLAVVAPLAVLPVDLMWAVSVSAQTVLPPVIVEGATRAVRPAEPVAPRAEPAPQASAPKAQPRVARPVARQAAKAAPGTVAAPVPGSAGDAAPGETVASVPSTSAPAGLLLSNQGTAATVITGDDLRQQQVRSPVEALRSIPGVVVSRIGPAAGLSQVGIRGMAGRHTVVIIDGIEANNPGDGEFDFSNLVGGDEIERIEVLRGPQSGLYGSGALGGVVNIVTKSGKGPLTVTGRAEYGSFNTRDVGATLSAGNDKAWGMFSTHTRQTAGFNVAPFGGERDGSKTTSSMFKGGFSPLEGLTIEGVLRHTGKQGNRDEENFLVPGLIQQMDAPSKFSSDLWLGALEGKLSLFGGAWVQSVRSERRSIVNDDLSINAAFAPSEFYERYRANAQTYRYTSTFRLDTPGVPQVRHFLTGLAEQKSEGFVQHTDDGVDHERRTRSVVGELRGEYWNSLFLSGAVRRDDNNVSGDFTTWRTSASFKVPSTPVRLHASTGTGVKLPSLFEQFGRAPTFFTPNPNLKPETSSGWDAGVELSLLGGRAVIDATWFDTAIKDQISSSFVGFLSTSINRPGVSTRQGLELSGKLIALPGLTIGGSYTLLDAKEPTGIEEIRRPRNTGRLDAKYTFDRERASVGIAAVYNGTMQDRALRMVDPVFFDIRTERVALKDYWLVSAMASYKITPQLELYGRVENLLDQRYQEVYGFSTPGLAVYGGVRMTLQDQSVASVR